LNKCKYILVFLFCFATQQSIAQSKKKKSPPKVADTVDRISAEDILTRFEDQDYEFVAQTGAQYLEKFPSDTAVAICTGISSIFLEKFDNGFQLIDKYLGKGETAIKFYAIMPFVHNAVRQGSIYDSVVAHCCTLNSAHIYSNFARSLLFKNKDNLDSALHYAQKVHVQIASAEDANNLGGIYPSLLNTKGEKDNALDVLVNLNARFKQQPNIMLALYDQSMRSANYKLAAKTLDELLQLDKNNSDYVDARIDLAIRMEDKDKACTLIRENNFENSMDAKFLLASCAVEMAKVPLKDGRIYTFKVTEKGKAYLMQCRLDAHAEEAINIYYSRSGEIADTGVYTINTKLFDSATRYDVRLFNPKLDTTNTLVMWLSRAAMREIANKKEIEMDLGKGRGTFYFIDNTIEQTDENAFTDRVIFPNGLSKLVSTIHLMNSDTNEHVWINNDYNNPMIIKLESDISYQLVDIK
jgi:tetratricopeptide (TPR) repeat protein